MEKVRIALIGSGRAGMIHARNFAGRVSFCTLTAVCDAFPEAAVAAAKELGVERYETDYEKIISDENIDAVVIATPTKYHCEIAVKAAKAGKHILCEKPMAMTVDECDLMYRTAKECGVVLQIGFMRRFDASFIAAKKMVDEGKIGDVVMVRSNTRGPSIPKPWMYDISKSNGPLAEVNSHDIDTLRWFTGSDFKTVYATAGNFRCPDAKKEFPDFYDNVTLNAKFENGCLGIIDGAQGVLYGYDARCEILGTKGCIYLGNTKENSVTLCTSDMQKSEEYVNSWRNLFTDAYLAEDRDFVETILEGREPKVNGYDGKMAVLTVNAGNLSIKENKVVEINKDSIFVR
ncbi:MAG: Gfo/Idh/MocA family oxidoreductase [Candidatus Borkfalkiaceae bacterium]|nr:Gfo/Idh/MocA family oxidoreductase [Christensenellaceae bacterium]